MGFFTGFATESCIGLDDYKRFNDSGVGRGCSGWRCTPRWVATFSAAWKLSTWFSTHGICKTTLDTFSRLLLRADENAFAVVARPWTPLVSLHRCPRSASLDKFLATPLFKILLKHEFDWGCGAYSDFLLLGVVYKLTFLLFYYYFFVPSVVKIPRVQWHTVSVGVLWLLGGGEIWSRTLW